MFDDEEDDFQPLIKKKKDKESADEKARTTKKTATKKGKPGKPVKTEDEDNKKKQKSISKPKRKTPKRKTPLKDRKKYDGFCPRCQMPYALFVIETPTWHEAECFESYRPELECPDGIDCDCTIQKHYYRYSHIQLAKKRQVVDDADQQKKSKQRLMYGDYKEVGTNKTDTILVDDSDEHSDTNQTVIPDTIPNTHKREILPLSTDALSPSNTSQISSNNDPQMVLWPKVFVSKNSKESDEISSSLPSIESQSVHENLSPRDYCNYMEDAFEEAAFCTGNSEDGTYEGRQDCELQASCSIESEKDLVESFLNDESSRSGLLYDDIGEASALSGKSVSDVDASEESNSKCTMDNCSEKASIDRTESLYKNDASCFSQTCRHCGKMYTFKHVCDENFKHSDDSELMKLGINLHGNKVSKEDSKGSKLSKNFAVDDQEEEIKSVSNFDDDSNSRSFFVNYRMKKDLEARDKCHACQLKLSGRIVVSYVDFMDYAQKNSNFINGEKGISLIDISSKKVELCEPCGNKVKESKYLNDEETHFQCNNDTGEECITDGTAHTVPLSQQSISLECDRKFSSSQGSNISDSTTGSGVSGSAKKKRARNKKGQINEGKTVNNHSDTGLSKQTSLLSFFSGGAKNSNGEEKCVKSGTDGLVKNRSSERPESLNQKNISSKLTKIKSVNDVLMFSKKSYDPSINETSSSSKSSLVKSASDESINKSLTLKRRWNNKDENDECSSTIGDKGKKPMRSCPFYKKIPDTGFTVDAFCYGEVPGCKAYFLSHFHYDHYRGLTKKFNQPIYCSQVTGNLIKSKINIRPNIVHCLPLDVPCKVEDTEVTLLDANHCPGSVLFLFRTKSGKTILHTGDFRADPSMEMVPCLQNVSIHQLYLDTTYCDQKYAFPPQNLVIDFGVTLVEKFLAEKPNTLVVCGSYNIGKERIFTAIARRFDSKVSVQRDKYKVLECLEDDDLSKRLTLNFNESFLHVLPMGKLNVQDLHNHRISLNKNYDYVLAIEPTGWTYNDKLLSLDQIKPKGSKDIKIYGLPYSEHSSFLELKRFVQFFRPQQILPTVNNGNPACRKKMEKIFHSWLTDTKPDNKPKQTNLGSWKK